MSTFVHHVVEKLSTICCAECAMTFAVPERFETDRRKDHKSFCCPAGHRQSFTAESDEEKMRRERDIARQQLARAEQETASVNRRLENEKKEVKKLKKRAAAGACPCCHRSFLNMAIHMRKQHPNFVAEQVAPALKVVK